MWCVVTQVRHHGRHFGNTLQHFTTLYNTWQHFTTHYNTLQHFTTLYNTLQHFTSSLYKFTLQVHFTTLYNTLQHFTTLYNTLLQVDGVETHRESIFVKDQTILTSTKASITTIPHLFDEGLSVNPTWASYPSPCILSLLLQSNIIKSISSALLRTPNISIL